MGVDKQSDLADRTFRFTCAIVRFCLKLSAQPGVTRRLAWQLTEEGTSIAANYEEAIAACSRRECRAKTPIVLKEACESRLWLRVIAANRLARPAGMKTLRAETIANAVVVEITGVALAWYLFLNVARTQPPF